MDDMATITENLQTIINSKLAMKQAIIDKGGTINGDITTWADAIRNISSKSEIGTVVKIKNKLNGATIGELNNLYSIEEILYEYECETSSEDSLEKNAICFSYRSLINTQDGIKLETVMNTINLNAFGDGDTSPHLYIHYELSYGTNFKVQIGLSRPHGEILNSDSEVIKTYFIVFDNEGNYDIDTFNIQYSTASCFLKNTQISLSNGLTKLVQDITYNDELLVWNFDEGKFDKAKPLWIKKEEKTNNYYKITLDNGSTINLVGSNGKCHRLFNYDDMIFESATELVGKNVHTLNGVHKVVSVENIKELVEYYNIITNYHMNCFANGILTSCRFNNLYPIKDMVFDKSNVNIEPRWKIHQKKFKPNPEILPKYIRGMRLDENQTISIEEMKEYITNLERRKKTVMDFEENLEYCSNIEDTEVGWISPEGEVFGYKLYMPGQHTHEIIANNICKKKNTDSNNYSKTLEQLGFVKYTNTFIACGETVDITEKQEIQIKKFINDNKKIKERGTIKINNYIGEDVKVQELYSFDKKSLSQKLRGKHGNKKN